MFGVLIGKFLSNNPKYFNLLEPKRWIRKAQKASGRKWLFLISISIIIGISSRFLVREIYIIVENLWQSPMAKDNIFSMIPLPILIISITIIPIFEEWIFRGVLLEEISKISDSKLFGLLLSSLLFASFHFSNPGTHISALIPYFIAGLFLGGSYIIGGLAMATLSHIFYNIFPFLIALIQSVLSL